MQISIYTVYIHTVYIIYAYVLLLSGSRSHKKGETTTSKMVETDDRNRLEQNKGNGREACIDQGDTKGFGPKDQPLNSETKVKRQVGNSLTSWAPIMCKTKPFRPIPRGEVRQFPPVAQGGKCHEMCHGNMAPTEY